MRGFAFTVTALAAVLGSALPAQAAWHYFGCPADNFASQFPDVPKVGSIQFSMERHGKALSARTYTTNVDNIVYRMLVADYSDRVLDGASILGEAMFQYVGDERRGIRNGKITRTQTPTMAKPRATNARRLMPTAAVTTRLYLNVRRPSRPAIAGGDRGANLQADGASLQSLCDASVAGRAPGRPAVSKSFQSLMPLRARWRRGSWPASCCESRVPHRRPSGLEHRRPQATH